MQTWLWSGYVLLIISFSAHRDLCMAFFLQSDQTTEVTPNRPVRARRCKDGCRCFTWSTCLRHTVLLWMCAVPCCSYYMVLQGKKSRHRFFVSKDGRYFIKTISAGKARRLRKVRTRDVGLDLQMKPNSVLAYSVLHKTWLGMNQTSADPWMKYRARAGHPNLASYHLFCCAASLQATFHIPHCLVPLPTTPHIWSIPPKICNVRLHVCTHER